jgi:hypothetical protein
VDAASLLVGRRVVDYRLDVDPSQRWNGFCFFIRSEHNGLRFAFIDAKSEVSLLTAPTQNDFVGAGIHRY